MNRVILIKNLFVEFGFVDCVKVVYWLVGNKFNIGKKWWGGVVRTVHSSSLEREIYIRPYSSDLILLIEFFAKEVQSGESREYQIEFEHHDKDVKYILDCGANIGLFSLIYSYRYPEAKIIAIEPESENFNILCMNVKNNKNIIVVQRGIWSKEVGLKIIPRDTGAYGFMVQECNEEQSDVEGVSIASLIKWYDFPRIDILKMDIEGSELEVITNNSSIWLKKTKIMILETHERIIAGSEKIIEDELLNKNQYIEGKSNGENRIFYKMS